MTESALPKGWQVRKLAPALGAEITGADLRDQSNAVIDALKNLLRENLVIFFPDQ
jgi:alpha-ketoglutarate-dependent taurine dioxygenase